MRKVITDEEFWRRLATFEHSAWRFEQQPSYAVGYERQIIDDFLAGRPSPPDTDLKQWFMQVKQQTAEGKTIGRVRVVDDPPTDYQRWLRWLDAWNIEAGETIDYLSRSQAFKVKLIPDVGPADWWLFDDQLLMLMHFNSKGVRTSVELVDDEPELRRARRFRDLAIRAAHEESAANA